MPTLDSARSAGNSAASSLPPPPPDIVALKRSQVAAAKFSRLHIDCVVRLKLRNEETVVALLTREELQSGRVHAVATDLSTGASQELTIREGSRNHFFEPFECGGYQIQLRIDWTDLDDQGSPTLDADFYDPATHAMDKSMRADAAHHTPAQADSERTYVWEFRDERRCLRVTLTWLQSLASEASATPTLSLRVIRAGENAPPGG